MKKMKKVIQLFKLGTLSFQLNVIKMTLSLLSLVLKPLLTLARVFPGSIFSGLLLKTLKFAKNIHAKSYEVLNEKINRISSVIEDETP